MEQAFDAKGAFGDIFGFMQRHVWVLLLGLIVACLTAKLTYDAGFFFGSWWSAILIEVAALAMVIWRPGNGFAWILKWAVLLGAFVLVVFGASQHAAEPHLNADNISPTDKAKLAAMNADIAAMQQSIEALKGQPRNTAMRTQQLGELVDQRRAFVESLQPDKDLQALNMAAVWAAVSFRIVLQLANWLLMHRLAEYIHSRKTENAGPGGDGPGRLIALPEDNRPLTGSAGRLLDWIAGKGTVTRAQVFQSKVLEGQDAYDKAIAELIRTAAISCNASGPMAGWTYEANTWDGRATA
jgi:hypothetical protein